MTKPLRVTHYSHMTVGDDQIEVGVLENTERGFLLRGAAKVFGLPEDISSIDFTNFAKEISPTASDLMNEQPRAVLLPSGETVAWVPHEALIFIADEIVDAKLFEKLDEKYDYLIEPCRALLTAFMYAGMAALCDEASGYQQDRPDDSLQSYFTQLQAAIDEVESEQSQPKEEKDE